LELITENSAIRFDPVISKLTVEWHELYCVHRRLYTILVNHAKKGRSLFDVLLTSGGAQSSLGGICFKRNLFGTADGPVRGQRDSRFSGAGRRIALVDRADDRPVSQLARFSVSRI
jgi:hypothetical protein